MKKLKYIITGSDTARKARPPAVSFRIQEREYLKEKSDSENDSHSTPMTRSIGPIPDVTVDLMTPPVAYETAIPAEAYDSYAPTPANAAATGMLAIAPVLYRSLSLSVGICDPTIHKI